MGVVGRRGRRRRKQSTTDGAYREVGRFYFLSNRPRDCHGAWASIAYSKGNFGAKTKKKKKKRRRRRRRRKFVEWPIWEKQRP